MGVVTATAAMTASSAITGGEKTDLALAIERAMIKAVEDCAADGVTDDDSVRAAMLEARDMTVRNGT